MKKSYGSVFIAISSALLLLCTSSASLACGGFFCTMQPINQAAEQIVFRQGEGRVTAMVRIMYTGDAEDFSWVVPVPDTPEISIGSDIIFNQLGAATQPRFQLAREGSVCPQEFLFEDVADDAASSPDADDAEDGGVVVEQELTVGPFDIDIISSDNPDELAFWLEDNGYLLTERGSELIEPYVLDGMKFVGLKLRSGEPVGSIQPIILDYPSELPAVPIRLTAVAAEDDMGVLVYLVNDQIGRAIPENYLHVTPNYARVDWFNGNFNAVNSYQSLITEAMNESGGQGFATDFAGTLSNDITSALFDPSFLESNLAELDELSSDAEFIAESLSVTRNFAAAASNLQTVLPLPEDTSPTVYFQPELLEWVYTEQELSDARITMRNFIVTRDIEPVQESIDLLPEGAYLTRLFTTLSAEEMTLDPVFNYNPSMPDQPRTRNALLRASCVNEVSNWQLILGAGTGRDGEVVADVTGEPDPFFAFAPVIEPIAEQPATFMRERTSADSEPEVLFEADLSTAVVGAASLDTPSGGGVFGGGSSGGGSLGVWSIILLSLMALRRRNRVKLN